MAKYCNFEQNIGRNRLDYRKKNRWKKSKICSSPICMYLCMYVLSCICMYICICVYKYIRTYVWTYICTVCMHVSTVHYCVNDYKQLTIYKYSTAYFPCVYVIVYVYYTHIICCKSCGITMYVQTYINYVRSYCIAV